MPVVANCSCGRRFQAQDHLAGKQVTCPSCGGVLNVPALPAPARHPSPPASIQAAPTQPVYPQQTYSQLTDTQPSHIANAPLPRQLPAMPTNVAKVHQNLRAICYLYIVYGSLCILSGIGMLLGSAQDAFLIWFGIAFILGGIGGIAAAIGALNKYKWSLIVIMVISAFYLWVFRRICG